MKYLFCGILSIIFSCQDFKISSNKKSEDSLISYFCTENETYIRNDLYAKFQDSVYVLVDSVNENCVSIERTEDFNKDGYTDVLVEFINGF